MEKMNASDFMDDEIKKINALPALDILAIVAAKSWEKEGFGEGRSCPLLELPMTEKKPLPFNLNLKPRTPRKPRSEPIDVEALFPCLHMKREREEEEKEDMDDDVKPPTPKRLKITFRIRAPDPLAQPAPPVQPDPPFQPAPPAQVDLPPEFRQRIAELGGSDPELVIQKSLFEADVLASKGRLAMPCRQCKVNFGEIGEMKVRLIYKGIDNELRETTMNFKKWDTVSSYVFNGHSEDATKRKKNGLWNELVEAVGLKTGDVVQVWSTWARDQLSFALLKL